MFNKQLVRINAKHHCISVKGVNLWHSCHKELKTCSALSNAKKLKQNALTQNENG